MLSPSAAAAAAAAKDGIAGKVLGASIMPLQVSQWPSGPRRPRWGKTTLLFLPASLVICRGGAGREGERGEVKRKTLDGILDETQGTKMAQFAVFMNEREFV
jgi:hypothetical protein